MAGTIGGVGSIPGGATSLGANWLTYNRMGVFGAQKPNGLTMNAGLGAGLWGFIEAIPADRAARERNARAGTARGDRREPADLAPLAPPGETAPEPTQAFRRRGGPARDGRMRSGFWRQPLRILKCVRHTGRHRAEPAVHAWALVHCTGSLSRDFSRGARITRARRSSLECEFR